MLLIWYPKCSTCRKAEQFLKEKGFNYQTRDIVLEKPQEEEIVDFLKKANLPIDKIFNTSGLVYKELNLKDKMQILTFDEKLKLLASNGKLIKRPILVLENKVLFGFKMDEWSKL